jgi:uncharacterized membrane protein YphA (DoxX/SURF4 family)
LVVNAILRLAVGGTFVLAGALKIADPAKFALDVGHYRVAPHALNNLVAILVPWIEVTAGSLVLLGIWLRAAALVIAAMTVMFSLVIISALARGLNIECGCFGTVGGRHAGLVSLAIDATLFSLAAALVRRSKDRLTNQIYRACLKNAFGPTACENGRGRCCASVTDLSQYAPSARLALAHFRRRFRPKPLFKQALREVGAQDSALPLKASPKASSAIEGASLSFVWGDALSDGPKNALRPPRGAAGRIRESILGWKNSL